MEQHTNHESDNIITGESLHNSPVIELTSAQREVIREIIAQGISSYDPSNAHIC